MVLDFEKKVEMLKDKRDRTLTLLKRTASLYPDVNNGLMKVDDLIITELNKMKGLEDEAKDKCFIGLCPNVKAFYQLSKKAKEDAGAVVELLQQGGFDRISYLDVPPPIVVVPPNDFEDFDSRKLEFNKIMEAVKDNNKIMEAMKDTNLNIIGVYGMPGVGKTTLVKEVIRQVKEDKLFDSVSMAVVTHTPDVQKIQELKFEEKSITGRASRLCQRLKKDRKILVVLDDIWTRLDLMEVGIPLGEKDQVCTILLTSRNSNVLKKDMIFEIGVLEDKEAWDFFKKIAGDGVESHDLPPIATQVAEKCGGLPIAIRTLATSLRNEPPCVWKDALRQLSKLSSSNFTGVPATVYSTIEWSYNRLQSEDHKQTLLLCSLLGHNAGLELLLMCAMGLGLFRGVSTVEEKRNRLLTVVSHLKASCLLLDGYINLHVDMHDLICDVTMSIAANHVFVLRQEDVLNDWPDDETMKECDKISLLFPSINKLPDQLKCPKLTFFVMCSNDPLMKIPANLLKDNEKSQINLRTLSLDHCALGDISLIGELKNLEILNFSGSDIEMLPEEIGQLTKLKWLELSVCSKLKRIAPSVLCKLSRLEELYINNSFDEWGAEGHSSVQSNSSLAELNALSCLTALQIHIPNAKIIPKDFSFEKLERYIIFIGEASHWDWNWDVVGEYSRTLKLSLQTSIRFLNNGVKVLLKKAENLYIDEVKGVEILLHELEVGNYFQQLKNLHIQNGEMVQYIPTESDSVQKIEFLELESLTLQAFAPKKKVQLPKIEFLELQSLTLKGLPNLISFCSTNKGSTSISPQEIGLFKQKIFFPKLEELKLSSISIERIWSPQAFCSTQNLTSLIIEGCDNLKHGLQNLIGFCHEDYTVEFPVLMILEIENYPELKGFIHNSMRKDTPTHGEGNEDMTQPTSYEFFFYAKRVDCSRILKKLIVTDCASLEVFQLQVQETYVVESRLRELNLVRLPKLEHVWTKYRKGNISFASLKQVCIEECWGLKTLFPFLIAKDLQQLETLEIQRSDEQEILFAFNQLSFLVLQYLPYLTCFYPRMHRSIWPALKQLIISECGRIKIFGYEESQIEHSLFLIKKGYPQLEEVSFSHGDIKMISDGQFEADLFCNIKFLQISCYFDESIVFLISFLKRFYNLEGLRLGSCNFKDLTSFESGACEDEDMIITIPRIKNLRLDEVNNIRHLWLQNSSLDHICSSLERLEVWNCGNLINLGLDLSSFENLTTLDVWKCEKMTELLTSLKAQTSMCLVTMRIRECKMMREVVTSDGDDTSYEIVFRSLKYLELHCLQSLTSFCSGNCTVRFPSMEQVTLSQCPRMKNFYQGVLSTPKLHRVRLTETDFEGRWAGDLNATVGYRGLKHLKLSKFPELKDIWSRNPQETLDFTTFEFLEVCDSNHLRYIFNLSMAFGLGQLRKIEIKRCGNLEQVIKEEGSFTTVEEAITYCSKIISIFLRLKSITVESCPDMTSFYLGNNKGLKCPSLVEIKVANCSNMTTFVSTFSRDEDKEARVGDEVDNVAAIFSDKSLEVTPANTNPIGYPATPTFMFTKKDFSHELILLMMEDIYDEMSLPNGVLRLSSSYCILTFLPTNGDLKTLTYAFLLPSEECDGASGWQSNPICRLDVYGIGSPPGAMDMKAYLLQKFSPGEKNQIDEALEQGVEAVRTVVLNGFKQKITRFNLGQKYNYHKIRFGIERIWLLQAFCSTQNLTSLIIEGCVNIKHAVSDSMIKYLQQL
ncbi:hypothetical protein CXB51_029582 [Gossypium anomalum]|uniref:AAA+ ATPase domain-containing protein n=1 Tax=Gossypium anomalum TaxID=47600 RepID=A0A8J5YGG9_9ROSI|nr:hypothetical protein CXB51_029582 [Gossypium anomalum]